MLLTSPFTQLLTLIDGQDLRINALLSDETLSSSPPAAPTHGRANAGLRQLVTWSTVIVWCDKQFQPNYVTPAPL